MGLNGFSQDPVQAPMSLSCCSAFEWLSPLGLGSGMRCEEQESSPLEQNSSASTSPPSRSNLLPFSFEILSEIIDCHHRDGDDQRDDHGRFIGGRKKSGSGGQRSRCGRLLQHLLPPVASTSSSAAANDGGNFNSSN